MKTVRDILYSLNHTRSRMISRYGILIDDEEYAEMCDRIDNKIDVRFISGKSKRKIFSKYMICPSKALLYE